LGITYWQIGNETSYDRNGFNLETAVKKIATVKLTAQYRLLVIVGIEHVMEREELDMVPGDFRHARRPPAIALGNQLDRRIGLAHGFGELDGQAVPITVEDGYRLDESYDCDPQLKAMCRILHDAGMFGTIRPWTWLWGSKAQGIFVP
jgi:hypothetical protein